MATRMNVNISDDIKAWLEKESKLSGLPQSTIILIGLKTYIDQQKTIEITDNLKKIQEMLGLNQAHTSE